MKNTKNHKVEEDQDNFNLWDEILLMFNIEKRIEGHNVLINISENGYEELNTNSHQEINDISNFYWNDNLNLIKQCYVFSSLLNVLCFFSKKQNLLTEKFLLVITGSTPEDNYLQKILPYTKKIDKFYFCINKDTDYKVAILKSYLLLCNSNHIKVVEKSNTWILEGNNKNRVLSKHLLRTDKFIKILENLDLFDKKIFEIISPKRGLTEFKNMYNFK